MPKLRATAMKVPNSDMYPDNTWGTVVTDQSAVVRMAIPSYAATLRFFLIFCFIGNCFWDKWNLHNLFFVTLPWQQWTISMFQRAAWTTGDVVTFLPAGALKTSP